MTRLRILLFLGVLGSLGASHRTDHFVVQAADEDIASQAGETAETSLKELALLWLGREMPDWQEPVLLRVTLTGSGMSGATTFAFDRGVILHVESMSKARLTRSLKPSSRMKSLTSFWPITFADRCHAGPMKAPPSSVSDCPYACATPSS